MNDRDAIVDVVARYAHAVDDRDIDRVLACFTTDGRIDFEAGASSGQGQDGIRAAYQHAFARPELVRPATSTHIMANTLVNVDGNVAHAETHGVAYLASPATGTVTTRGLRYSDEFRREGGVWRIAHRVHRSLWQTAAPGEVH